MEDLIMEERVGLNPARIKVVGVGGGGCNAVNRMFTDGIESVEVYAVNTDIQHLGMLEVPHKIQIGEKVTRGLGAGAKPEIGEQAALEDVDKIKDALKDTDMVFIAAGLGGGTGTGAAPVIAQTAKEMGILTVGVVTLPFKFEGPRKMDIALKGLEKLKDNTDTYIVVHNQRLQEISNKGLKFKEALKEVDSVLSRAVRSITNVLATNAVINVDFADMKTIMENGKLTLIGMGSSKEMGDVESAVEQAINSPLLEGRSIEGARRVLVTIWISENTEYSDVERAMEEVYKRAGSDPEVIFGAVEDESQDAYIKVAIIATDFDKQQTETQEENVFRVVKREPQNLRKAVPEENINPVEPEEEIPAILRRKRKI